MKKRLALFLIICLLLTSIPIMSYPISIAQTADKNKYDGGQFFMKDPYNGLSWNDYKLNNGIPSTIKQSITKLVGGKIQTYYFNMELFADKEIIVYGDYTFVTQDFKPATGSLDIYGNYVLLNNQGYYAGGTGEYRYHGFDAQGELYANDSFPIDAISGKKAEEKKWIFKYWSEKENDLGSSFLKIPSDYNRIANGNLKLGSQFQNTMISMINNALPFELLNTNKPDKNAYNYANVMTAPSTKYPGEVELVNWGWSTRKQANSEFYQIFSTNTTKQKIITPITAITTAYTDGEGVEGEKAYIDVTVNVKGEIQDQHLFDGVDTEGITDEVRRSIEYNRDDIDYWSFELRNDLDARILNQKGRKISFQAGATDFTIRFYSDAYENRRDSDGKLDITFFGKAICHFDTGEKSEATSEAKLSFVPPVIDEKTSIQIDIKAPKEMLDTEKFKLVDHTKIDGDEFERWVELEGKKLSKEDEEKFLAGTYVFPFLGMDKIYTYNVHYSNLDEIVYDYKSYVIVYTTKPRAQFFVTGTYKENRLIETASDIDGINSSYLKANSTFETLKYDATEENGAEQGGESLVRYGKRDTSSIQFIVKGQAQINIQMQIKANIIPSKIERSDIPVGYHTSDMYTYKLFIMEDLKPAMLANVWNPSLLRNETLDFTYDASSVDGDFVTINTYEIYYDQNGDDRAEELIKSGNYSDFEAFKPDKLGIYKVKFYAEETFGEPTLPQYIIETDKRFATIERTFSVENLSPMSKLYTDIEYDFPKADVMVLTDKDITRASNSSIVNNRVAWMNTLRQSGIDASVQNWDLFTYTYSQDVSPVFNTGGSVPPQTKPYSSGGYSGTVSKINQINNQYQVDEGYSYTVTDTMTDSTSESQGDTAIYTYKGGSWHLTTPWNMTQLPTSKSWSNNGYTGTLYKDSRSGLDYDDGPPSGKGEDGETYERSASWTAYYSGTLTKSVTKWQPIYVWYDNYTGYYAGTIYKYVKQSFIPTFRMNSNKYIVYLADSYINHKDDIQAVLNKGNSKLILVGKGTSNIETQFAHDYFVDNNGKSLDTVMDEINRIIVEDNPYENNQLLLVNETFTLNTADYDHENDPISPYGFMYIHDAHYYDNTMGLETGTATSQEVGTYTNNIKTSFSKVGHYTIYRKTKDIPTGFSSFTQDSNLAKLDIYVHRKPIADFNLSWEYDASTSKYLTTWVDESYDLDHQYSDPQKGIIDRRIMYRKTNGNNVWIYAIPDNLTAGTYEVRYSVKDIEGVWSDEITKIYTLTEEPPIRLKAKLKSITPPYEITNIPASEKLQIYEINTNYHAAHNLSISISDKNGLKLKDEALLLSTEIPKDNILGNNYKWRDVSFTIPETYADGDYSVKIEAYSVANPTIKTVLNLPFHVKTPVTIIGDIDALILGEMAHITATTNQYASEASALLYKGTPYQTRVSLKKALDQPDATSILWEQEVLVTANIPEENYKVEFEALTTGGNRALYTINKEVMALKVKSASIVGYWNHWRGQIDAFGARMTNDPHRFLSYEKVKLSAEVIGDPEEVVVNFSPELEAMAYTNSLGQTYYYKTEMGYEPNFPLKLTKTSGDTSRSIWEGEYILPLARETLSWENIRLSPSYTCTFMAKKAANKSELTIDDIEMTGNIYDMTYHQPKYKN